MTGVDGSVQYLISDTFRPSSPPYADRGSLTSPSGPRVIRVIRSDPSDPHPSRAPAWLRRAVAQIETLTALAPGWDSYDARPVEADAAMQAVRFLLDGVPTNLAEPSIVPLVDGGIQLEWHQGGVDVEISFSDLESGIYIEDHAAGTSIDEPLPVASSLLIEFAPRLAPT